MHFPQEEAVALPSQLVSLGGQDSLVQAPFRREAMASRKERARPPVWHCCSVLSMCQHLAAFSEDLQSLVLEDFLLLPFFNRSSELHLHFAVEGPGAQRS